MFCGTISHFCGTISHFVVLLWYICEIFVVFFAMGITMDETATELMWISFFLMSYDSVMLLRQ